MTRIPFKKQGHLGRIADMLMVPVMYLLQGNFRETPQRTHRWNNHHLRNLEVDHLDADNILFVDGDPGANERWFGPIPLFHMPVFGGWKKFVVVEPVHQVDEWFIGWVAFDALGVSRIPLQGPVRLGIGPRQAEFFALDSQGKQIELSKVAVGHIGSAGEYSDVLFL